LAPNLAADKMYDMPFPVTRMDAGQAAALGIGVIACAFDLRTRHIPNVLTFGGAGVALAYALWAYGWAGLALGVGGWFTGFALFVPLFLLGGMGAGDVKLLACLGAWLGPHLTLWTALYAMVAGGFMAVLVALFTGYLREALFNVWMLLAHFRSHGLKPAPMLTLSTARGPRLPYALPIATGAALAIWLKA
jgi:prepilin peptidase CpaA